MLATLVADFEGRYDQAIDEPAAGIATAEEIGDVALVAEGHLRLAAILMSRGDLAAAERNCAGAWSSRGSSAATASRRRRHPGSG